MPVGVRVPVSGEDHTQSLTPTIVRVLDPGEDRHGRSCLLFMFQLPVGTTHGPSRSFVFHSPVRTAHSQPLLNLLQFFLSTHLYTTLPKRRS